MAIDECVGRVLVDLRTSMKTYIYAYHSICTCNCVLCGVSYVDHDSGLCKQYAKNGNKYDISLLVFN